MYNIFGKFYFSEKYSVYEIQVSASTVVGGSRNASGEFKTAQDGKLYPMHILCCNGYWDKGNFQR